ncbi:hypothetical protein AB1Y20_010273 [Prymnesium parvum]|uniref:Uncharacterized protein n=1 Tax=Prymnesium parvum TaxID=97485 RepID=A0AB34K3Z7_PRYPA
MRSTTSSSSNLASTVTYNVYTRTHFAKTNKPRKHQAVVQGEEVAATGQHAAAITLFSKAIERNPCDLDAHIGRGLSAAAIGEHERAVYDFSMALQLRPTIGHYLARGASLAALRQFTTVPGALRDYSSAIELAVAQRRDDVLATALMTRARLLETLERYDEAADELGRVLATFTAAEFDAAFRSADSCSADDGVSRTFSSMTLRPSDSMNAAAALEIDQRASNAFAPAERGKRHTQRAEAHARRGACYRKMGRMAESVKDLRRAVALAPRDTRHRRSLAESLINLGEAEEAAEQIDRALELSDGRNDPEILRMRAAVSLKLNQPEAAITLLHEALKREPKQPHAHQALADGWRAANHKSSALECYREARRLSQLRLADAERRLAVEKKAEHDAQYDARSRLAVAAALAEVSAQRLAAAGALARAAHGMGMVFASLDRLEEARDSFEEALQHAPERDDTRMELALTLIAQGWRLQALAELETCVERQPEWSAPRRLRAELMVERGLLNEAEAEYSTLLRCEGSSALDNLARGQVYCELNKPAEALADFETALAGWPGGEEKATADLWLYRASALRSLHRRDEALVELQEALSRAMQPASREANAEKASHFFADVHGLYGQCLHEQHRLPQAYAEYTHALHYRPGDGVMLLLRGAAAYRSKQWQGAVNDVRAALEPGALEAEPLVVADAHQLLGLALARCGEHWAAVASLSAALEVSPQSSQALLQRGSLLLMLGRVAAALDDLNAALQLRPGWALALHRRAFIHKELLQFLEAADDFEAAARNDAQLRVNYLHVYREQLPDDAYDDDSEWQPATSLLDFVRPQATHVAKSALLPSRASSGATRYDDDARGCLSDASSSVEEHDGHDSDDDESARSGHGSALSEEELSRPELQIPSWRDGDEVPTNS